MNKLLLFLALLPAAGLSAAAQRAPDPEVRLGSYNLRSKAVQRAPLTMLKSTYEDGMPIREAWIERRDGRFYLFLASARSRTPIRAGRKATCRTTRIALHDDGRGGLFLRKSAAVDSCDGNPCSWCSEPSSTGCNCNHADGMCNHKNGGFAFSYLANPS
jgi:hypothetical protein